MKKFFTFCIGLFLSASSLQATTITVGTGTLTSSYPLNDYYIYSRSQMLFLASEITVGGSITHLRWYRNDTGADPDAIGSTEIWLMETTATVLSGTAWEGPGTLVASIANIDLGPGNGWYEVDITDFVYSGTSNLLVSVYTQNAPFLAPHATWRYTATSAYRMRSGSSDTQNPPTMSLGFNRPNIQFEISVAGPPNCANLGSPPDLSANVVPSATLNWSAGSGGDPAGYKLYFGTDNPPTNLVNGTNLGLVTTYDPIPDMSPLTTHLWKIVPWNSFGDATDCPVWSFTTGPDPTIVSFPYCESFDGTDFPPYGWITAKTAGTGNPGTWNRVTTGTNPTCSPQSGPGMARYNCFSLAAGTKGILVTPPINFPSDQHKVEFWMYRDNGYPAYADLVNVYYNTSPNLTGAVLLGTVNRSRSLAPVVAADGWYQYSFDMPPGSGGDGRYVIFEGESQYGNNIFVDDVCLVSMLCPTPTGLTAMDITTISAVIGWNCPGGSFFDVEIGELPYTFTGVPTFSTSSNPHTLLNLTHDKTYSFRVRNNCGSNGNSSWSATYTFSTVCDNVRTIPYYQNFDGVIAPAIPPCMTVTNDNGDTKLWQTGTNNPLSAPNEISISYNGTMAMDDWFFTPGLELTAGIIYTVKFYYRAMSASYPEKLRVLWGTAPSAGGMTGGTIWDNNNIVNTTYLEGSGTFSPPVSGVYYVGWNGYSDANMFILFVDDISITGQVYISAGIDQYTAPGGRIGFGPGRDYPVIPPGFFGPGSDPFDGDVYLEGEHSHGSQDPAADIKINRPVSVTFPCEPPCDQIIPTEMLQLDLVSSAPIIVHRLSPEPDPHWINSFFDVYCQIPMGTPTAGMSDIILTSYSGGTFGLHFSVNPQMTFVNRDDPTETYTLNPEAMGWSPLMYNSTSPYEWMIPPTGACCDAGSCSEFVPQGDNNLDLVTASGSTLSLLPLSIHENNHTSVSFNEQGTPYEWYGDGWACGTYYYYPGSDWWNVWWYDHPIRTNRTKYIINPVMTIAPRNSQLPSSVQVVYTYTTPFYPTWTSMARPPLPSDVTTYTENQYIQRSPPLFEWMGPIYEPIQIPLITPYHIPYYNPEWISIDLRGYNFMFYAFLNHVCWRPATRSFDFGDAPVPYPTLLVNNGARHIIVAGVFMGNLIDAEGDGQPNINATGDNINNLNDEDGVTFNTALNPGQPALLTVRTSIANGLLQAWIDFNADGDWSEPGEQIAANLVTIAGDNLVNYNVPAGATPGNTFARFRFSTMPNLTYEGQAPNGEVEDYQVHIEQVEMLDYGDAPDGPYPTLLASNGARHICAGPVLGNQRDAEPDGQPTLNADGDDLNPPTGFDDEDGVWWPCNFVPGHKTTIQVTASGPGLLNAWFDFEANGTWAEPGNQIFTDTPLLAGVNYLSVTVPANAQIGPAYARFRFSTQQGLTYTGQAPDGEVEDYLFNVEPAVPMDWGDLPDPTYPTLAASDGPRHAQGPPAGVFMGNIVDYEPDGQPNPFAAGDIPDEDGVRFNTQLIPGQPATVIITVSVIGPLLQGWIDFNADGDLNDPGEQILANVNPPALTQAYVFNVPAGAVIGKTYARFRFSTMPNLSWYGCVTNGEVEDYVLYIGEYDLGDAPDPTYPTLLASDGAIHKITGLYMGTFIDGEPDGQPDPNATGDDISATGIDDEDGVWWACNFVTGFRHTLKVTTTGPGFLNAWFDYNIDGDWSEPGEQVFTNIPLPGGTTELYVTVPVNATAGYTFARFRFSSQQNLSCTGYAPDGEVEDYSLWIQGPGNFDFGDLPDPTYPTLGVNDGARHYNDPFMPVFLGNLIDWELDGQPTADAKGDDNNNLPDEDGIVFNTPLVPGLPANITVIASISGGAFQGWIDFNANGSLGDAGEQIFINMVLAAGPQVLNFVVPAGAQLGNTYARFRYSTMGNLSWYGCAPNGEVEDYRVLIGQPATYDWGDLPDPAYPTLSSNNGPSHVVGGLFLGNLIDSENDGQPHLSALGDDMNNLADDDGVVFNSNIIPGQVITVTVTASQGGGFLQGWIDMNADGDFIDAGEQIFTDQALSAGGNTVTFTVIPTAKPGATFARFRLSTSQNLGSTGPAPDGEVEDYKVYIVNPGDGKMHWTQLPDLNPTGMDVDLTWVPTADDFLCTESGPISRIRIWVSFADDILPAMLNGDTVRLRIFSDIPAGVMHDWSTPGEVLWSRTYFSGQYDAILVSDNAPEWWYDPATQFWQPNNHQKVVRFDFDLGSEPFNQVMSHVYWLEVKYLYHEPPNLTNTLGWKTTRYDLRFNDDAVWWNANNPNFPIGWAPHVYPGAPNPHPYAGQSFDMAFMINPPVVLYDYGDAPDPNYPTLLASNGARHVNTGSMLGNQRDAEANGQPTINADGDDLNPPTGFDDEDGVWWPCNFTPGHTNTVKVTTTGQGFLNAWFDFNGDGDWSESDEQAITDVLLPGGTVDLFVTVPPNALPGVTYARFRLSSQPGLSYAGYSPDGEVEDYSIFIQPEEPMDYGDAPDQNYRTLAISNGARHSNIPGANNIFLGNIIDYEINGQPTPNADGDDLNPPTGFDDEDGVVFNTPLVPGLAATITVTASTGGGAFQGWIDFNADGDFADPGEQIFTNMILAAGPQPLNFNVPASAQLGNTYARFRYSTMGNLSWYGCAPDGEVEDYLAQIVLPQPDMEYGDAPAPYPTLMVNDGARHAGGNLWLGPQIDFEPNGIPDPAALGDDNNNLDDEDGVWWPCNFVPGQTNTLQVTASGPGLLNAWFDFEANGTWAEPGNQIFTNMLLSAGVNNLSVTVPVNAQIGPTYARFRFSTQQNLTYTGAASDGEVEDYQVVIDSVTPMDWGDVPDPAYPTLAVSNGARHDQAPSLGMFLGNLIDYEPDGQPDPNATGDDLNNLPDEDGVTFQTPLIPGQAATISVTATMGGGYFQGWIDFYANGNWTDPGEQIFTNVILVTGPQLLSFNVPVNAITGPTFARFRYSTMPNIPYYGYAPNGEVEDYHAVIEPEGPVFKEFGDAPEGVPAYPPTGIIGLFPTCMTVGPSGWIEHNNSNSFFGPSADLETDGNAGLCPVFLPNNYDQDECFLDGDAGLIMPTPYTIITGTMGNLTIVPCNNVVNPTALGIVCTQASWGFNVDIHVQNFLPPCEVAFVNVLFDWNMDGQWGGSSICSGGPVAPEHVLVNFPVPCPFSGPLSALMPPPFIIGPNPGHVWARFTITDMPVPVPWEGAGAFLEGETEDYLIRVCPEIPFDLNLQNIIINPGEDVCYNAYNAITVSGVTVMPGGRMNLVAGNLIRLLPDTKVWLAGYLHASISMSNFCCYSYPSMMPVSVFTGEEQEAIVEGVTMAKGAFKVYPNPTTGMLTLELADNALKATTVVEIYGMMGDRIMREEFTGLKKHEFSLATQPPGIYILRVITGNESGTVKVIRQ